jgi:hypothetical protein
MKTKEEAALRAEALKLREDFLRSVRAIHECQGGGKKVVKALNKWDIATKRLRAAETPGTKRVALVQSACSGRYYPLMVDNDNENCKLRIEIYVKCQRESGHEGKCRFDW